MSCRPPRRRSGLAFNLVMAPQRLVVLINVSSRVSVVIDTFYRDSSRVDSTKKQNEHLSTAVPIIACALIRSFGFVFGLFRLKSFNTKVSFAITTISVLEIKVKIPKLPKSPTWSFLFFSWEFKPRSKSPRTCCDLNIDCISLWNGK